MEDSASEVDSSDQEDGFVPRDRSNTCGSLSDLGKKRKQEPLAQESRSDQNPEEEKEPKQKRVKPTSKLKRFSQSFQRLSFRTDARASPLTPRLWGKGSRGPSKARGVKLWSETFDSVSEELSLTEVRRQEAIFELTQGEQSLIDDLNITKKAYFEPMLKLSIMSEDELNQIFGSLYSLIPLHEDLLSRLQQVRKADGTVSEVGAILIEWFPLLQAYEQYCCNLIAAKSLLDYKKQEQRVTEFLTLCQESSFSRKLDLWNFLDLPRSRLFKYPLLLREIARYTPAQHPDCRQLDTAIELIQGIVARVNLKTGEAECHYYRERLLYLDHSQNEPLIHSSKVLCCHGELRNNKGAKLQVFLFDQVLVITRTVSRNDLPL
ncbi:rho guanine nucleotide exchange factor 3-like, partial [Hemiscyllium ocellatum]|uniref:rho guanine nucleotide exchange factor 3-like n=1 Tax=Hemiscyllium ocellatum TaxID=170820 RepID=UPI002966E6BD